MKKFLESNENTMYQNLREREKAMLSGKFITVSAHIKKKETSQINNLMMHLKLLEKQKQNEPQTSRQTEIIKIRFKINEIKTKYAI
jgi:hypothetical protein